jgi:predicted transcriptional regulator
MLKPMSANAHDVKQAAHQLIDQLPDNVGWDELVYRMAVRREIEKGLADSAAGRVTPVEEVMKRFGVADQ